jgi:hypothetical protein
MTAKGVSPHDLRSGQRIEAEVKVLFLGNGGVGKRSFVAGCAIWNLIRASL